VSSVGSPTPNGLPDWAPSLGGSVWRIREGPAPVLEGPARGSAHDYVEHYPIRLRRARDFLGTHDVRLRAQVLASTVQLVRYSSAPGLRRDLRPYPAQVVLGAEAACLRGRAQRAVPEAASSAQKHRGGFLMGLLAGFVPFALRGAEGLGAARLAGSPHPRRSSEPRRRRIRNSGPRCRSLSRAGALSQP
jgi:hypothetical protein